MSVNIQLFGSKTKFTVTLTENYDEFIEIIHQKLFLKDNDNIRIIFQAKVINKKNYYLIKNNDSIIVMKTKNIKKKNIPNKNEHHCSSHIPIDNDETNNNETNNDETNNNETNNDELNNNEFDDDKKYSYSDIKIFTGVFLDFCIKNENMRSLIDNKEMNILNEVYKNNQLNNIMKSILGQMPQIKSSIKNKEDLNIRIKIDNDGYNLSEDDKKNIGKLLDYGFNAESIMKVYLEENRNFERTLNRLLDY